VFHFSLAGFFKLFTDEKNSVRIEPFNPFGWKYDIFISNKSTYKSQGSCMVFSFNVNFEVATSKVQPIDKFPMSPTVFLRVFSTI
jgi:hypothetical protein